MDNRIQQITNMAGASNTGSFLVPTAHGDVYAELLRNESRGIYFILLYGHSVSRREVRSIVVKERQFKRFTGTEDLLQYYVTKVQQARGLGFTDPNQLPITFEKAA